MKKAMQFRDLQKQYKVLQPEIHSAMREVMDSSNYILGQQVDELEKLLADYVGRKYCISCANGTDALTLALMAMDIGPGDAVFTSDFTYFASAGCASVLGATPIFVDIDQSTFNLDPNALEENINDVLQEGKLKPKVIIPVDLFGLPCDYDAINSIANKYDLKILEDAAQAFGAEYKNKKTCSFGNISATSFFPAKPLGCYGDGGAIFTDNKSIDSRLRSLRAQGKSQKDKYDNREIGMNSRLDTLQAAILIPKFHALKDYELEAVNNIANAYSNVLNDKVTTPIVPNDYYSSWAQYTILLQNEVQRNQVKEALAKEDIPSMIYYPRGLHQQEAYNNMHLTDKDYPNTVDVCKRCLSLPMHPYLEDKDIEKIVKVVNGNL